MYTGDRGYPFQKEGAEGDFTLSFSPPSTYQSSGDRATRVALYFPLFEKDAQAASQGISNRGGNTLVR